LECGAFPPLCLDCFSGLSVKGPKKKSGGKAPHMPAAFSKTSMLGQKSRLFLIAARLSKRYSH
jgi:hypothetical protein